MAQDMPGELITRRLDALRATAPATQHEVNNLVMVLASNLEMLARHVPEGAARRQLDRATEAARRLDEVTRGFLDAARRPPADVARVGLTEVLCPALALLRVALGPRHELDANLPLGLPAVLVDRARLELALLAVMREVARLPPGTRIGLDLAQDGPDVVLDLALPPGAALSAGCLGTLAEAGAATGGSLHPGPTLRFPIAP